jgi:hypothetical protein
LAWGGAAEQQSLTSEPRAFPSAARANRALFFVPERTKASRLPPASTKASMAERRSTSSHMPPKASGKNED